MKTVSPSGNGKGCSGSRSAGAPGGSNSTINQLEELFIRLIPLGGFIEVRNLSILFFYIYVFVGHLTCCSSTLNEPTLQLG